MDLAHSSQPEEIHFLMFIFIIFFIFNFIVSVFSPKNLRYLSIFNWFKYEIHISKYKILFWVLLNILFKFSNYIIVLSGIQKSLLSTYLVLSYHTTQALKKGKGI